MAYSPIKQAHADPTTASYQGLTLGTTPSPHLAGLPLTPLSLSFEDFTVDAAGQEHDPDTRPDHGESKVSKFLTSLTSSSRKSYDLVEDDDYEVIEQTTPTLERRSKTAMATTAGTAHGDKPIRTASISRQLPMNHPIPDLQSLQGAYIKNVERLEETAERLSMKSGLEGELQRLKHEQRRRDRTTSGSSHGNSIRSGPPGQTSVRSFSASAAGIDTESNHRTSPEAPFVASPVGSLRSPASAHNVSNHRLSRSSKLSHALPEPALEGRPLDSNMVSSTPQDVPVLDPRPTRSSSPPNASQIERPTTSGSGDTYQQARMLFNDFDGVHYAPDKPTRTSRRISLNRPPRARDSRAFKEPQPGEEMIFYPAPVPVMLNLPVRLSRMNWGEQEKKRLKALSGIPDEMRKSAAWLANEEGIPAQNRQSALPPQLRASAFFDHRSVAQEVQLKDGSAVATLDSILDAAAHAPVSAFTDHPIAGNLGHDFYSAEQPSRKSMQMPVEKKTKRKSSMSNLLKVRRSSGNLSEAVARESRVPSALLSRRDGEESEEDHVEDDAEKSIAPDADEMPEQEQEEVEEDDASDAASESHESHFHQGFSAAPTTLLAELQMRKAQQKMRNRTAVDAFPNGMHSTLLELDTVTQLQQKARRQKHVKLAWEDKDAVDKENFEDDDVPLGLLFPEKEQQNHVNVNRPLGLMEKKELEENEPLSQRRARLRGEPLQPPAPARSPGLSQQEEDSDKPRLDLPNLDESENDNNEEETLAQRRERMKNRKENGSSAEFAQHLSAELGLKPEVKNRATSSKTPDVEETLGQRRKRLQAEALGNGTRNVSGDSLAVRPALRPKRSLADVLQANPVGFVDANEAKTAHLAMQTQERAKEREAKFLAAQQADRNQAYARNKFGNGHQGGLIQSSAGNYSAYQQQPYAAVNTPYVAGGLTTNHFQTNFAYPSMASFHTQPTYGHPSMVMPSMQTNYPQQQQMGPGYLYHPAMDLTGMGPPLDSKQRARIEGWRQGIM